MPTETGFGNGRIAPEVRAAISHDPDALCAVDAAVRRNPDDGRPIFIRCTHGGGVVVFGDIGPGWMTINNDAPAIPVQEIRQ